MSVRGVASGGERGRLVVAARPRSSAMSEPIPRHVERLRSYVAFATLFGIVAAYMLMQTVRDAVFLSRLSASELPWVYLAIAGATTVLAGFQGRLRRRGPRAQTLALLLLCSALVTMLFQAAISADTLWSVYGLYVWTGIFGTLATFEFWLLLSRMYSSTEAKHQYAFIGIGSVTGALAGAVLAAWLTRVVAVADALWVAVGLMLAAAMAGRLGLRASPHDADAAIWGRRHSGMREDWRRAIGHPYVRRLALLALVSGVTLTLADFWFKDIVDRNVAPDHMAAFLGTTYAGLHALALVTQIGLTGWLLRTMGAPRTLWIVPGVVMLGAGGGLLGLGLAAAIVVKGADESLRHTIDRTANEVLHVPIPHDIRAASKGIIDLTARRSAQAAGAFAILAIVATNVGPRALPIALVLGGITWVVLATGVRRDYLGVFRTALREQAVSPTSATGPLGVEEIEALLEALGSDDDEVLAALDMLGHHGKAALVPALIVHHPSSAVVMRALQLFTEAGRTDFIPAAERRIAEGAAPEIRAAVLRARTKTRADPRPLERAREDPSPLVRATALVGLAALGRAGIEDVSRVLDGPLSAASDDAKIALAESLRLTPQPLFDPLLGRLAHDPKPAVRAAAARAIAVRGTAGFVDHLIPLLRDRATRAEARQALVAIGRPALQRLDQAFADATLPARLRVHLPRTVSCFPPGRAVPILAKRLLDETDGAVHYKILRGLTHLCRSARLRSQVQHLRPAVITELRRAIELTHWRGILERRAQSDPGLVTAAHVLLVDVLRGKIEHALERAFRLQTLITGDEDFVRIYWGLRSRRRPIRARSRDLLEELLSGVIRRPLLALVDHASVEDILAAGAELYAATELSFEELLRSLARDESESLRAVAHHHADEMGVFVGRAGVRQDGSDDTSAAAPAWEVT